MIVECVECKSNISDNALICPKCGYPYKIIDFIGDKINTSLRDILFKDLYELWLNEHSPYVSNSRVVTYNVSFKHCALLHNKKVKDIRCLQIKEVINSIDREPTKKTVKILLNMLFDYALENEIVDKNYARITKINADFNKVFNPHRSLKDEEIQVILNHSYLNVARMILIQCFTGLRPGELMLLRLDNIHLEEMYFIGGLKTKAGINRTVPIHPFIYEFIKDFYMEAKKYNSEYLILNDHHKHLTYKNYLLKFKDFCKNHDLHDLRPHDCRKYFVTQAKKVKMDEYALKRIVGHEINDITEKVYTERSIDWLKEEIRKIPDLILK